MAAIYLIVKLVLTNGPNPEEVAEDLDYLFDHKDILDTEILDVLDEYELLDPRTEVQCPKSN